MRRLPLKTQYCEIALEEDSFAYDLQLNTSGSPLVAIRKKYNQEKHISLASTHALGGSTEMNRIQKVRFQTPQENFMSIPSYLNPQAIVQNLPICIRRLEEEDGEEEEEETVDDLLIRIRLLVEEEEDKEEEEAVEADDVNNVRRSTREKKANSKYQNKVK
ncbi:hypothetical protein Bca4012_101119 [Brassica carinata]